MISRHTFLCAALLPLLAATAYGQTPAPPAAEAEHHAGPGWDTHPVLWLGRAGRIDLRLRLQQDVRSSAAPLADGAWFLALRRVGIGGQLAGGVDFEITGEMGLDRPWRDVYVNVHRRAWAMVQAGKFKAPFGLDQLTSESSYDFIYRSRIADQLSPGRERGAMVSGRGLARVLGYQLGVFVHDGNNARTTDPTRVIGGRMVVARATLQPFARTQTRWADLQIGVDATNGHVDEGIVSVRGRTAARAVFFSPRIAVAGAERRAGADVQWRPGPISVKAEFARMSIARDDIGAPPASLPALTSSGWYLSGSWMLTGEAKASAADGPHRPLGRGGFGGLEIAARVESLGFDPHDGRTPGNRDRAETLGVNWYIDRWVKLQFNAVHERLADPALGPLPARAAFWTDVVRAQFRF